MKRYKIGEVFEDAENLKEPTRVKCINCRTWISCDICIYDYNMSGCINNICVGRSFIETTKPLTKL